MEMKFKNRLTESGILSSPAKVGVLMGGPSTEREISLRSGTAVYKALLDAGLKAIAVDIITDEARENFRLLESLKLDSAFIALHGRFGEDGGIQKILDELDIPYTGSGVKASQAAMDKVRSKDLFKKSGLRVPFSITLNRNSYPRQPGKRLDLDFPAVIKPATNGSSIGLSIVDEAKDLDGAIEEAFSYDENVLIEEYIVGREFTVGILDNRALPVIEIVSSRRFFDYRAKYEKGFTEYIVPAQLKKETAADLQKTAFLAHSSLNCFGYSRVDIILDKNNAAIVLEVNTVPGLTEVSLFPKAAQSAGMDFQQLCLRLLKTAYSKTSLRAAARIA